MEGGQHLITKRVSHPLVLISVSETWYLLACYISLDKGSRRLRQTDKRQAWGPQVVHSWDHLS